MSLLYGYCRWEGVPFILKAGKALDDRKAEVRVQFKRPPGATFMFDGQVSRQSYGCCDSATSQSVPQHSALTALVCEQVCPPNELVIRLQPKEAIYLKTNVKAPGLRNTPTQAELDLTYHMRYPDVRVAAMGCIRIQAEIVYTLGFSPSACPPHCVCLSACHAPPTRPTTRTPTRGCCSTSFAASSRPSCVTTSCARHGASGRRCSTPSTKVRRCLLLLFLLRPAKSRPPVTRRDPVTGALNPVPYTYGSRGPPEADDFAQHHGFEYSTRYQWSAPGNSSPSGSAHSSVNGKL